MSGSNSDSGGVLTFEDTPSRALVPSVVPTLGHRHNCKKGHDWKPRSIVDLRIDQLRCRSNADKQSLTRDSILISLLSAESTPLNKLP